MYRILQEEGVDLPRYAVLNRDPDRPEGEWGRQGTLEARQVSQLPDEWEVAPFAALKLTEVDRGLRTHNAWLYLCNLVGEG